MNFYLIYTEEMYNETMKNVAERKKDIKALEKKRFKSKKVKEKIEDMKQDVSDAEKACKEYSDRIKEVQKRRLATIYHDENIKVVGTSFKKDQVENAVRFIIEECVFDKYEGMNNEDIEECGEKVYKYDGFQTSVVSLIPEPENEYDKNAVKVYVDEFFIGYLPKEKSADISVFLKKDNIETSVKIYLIGGPYKEFDYYEDKVKTIKSDFGFRIGLSILDSSKL